ncbi:SPFH domain-containing protein [Oscillospiraceae bacterium PP1C4]
MEAYKQHFIVGGCVILFLVLLISMWRRVPVDKALVITGLKKRVLSGKGGIVIPILETSCGISLENIVMTTDVIEAPSKQGIFVDVVGTAVIKVDNTTDAILRATEQFCTRGAAQTIVTIQKMVEQILEGKLRGVISAMTVEEINGDRATFEQRIEADVTKELTEMGLKLLSYSILKIATQSGYLENRARPQIAQSIAEAEIAEAERKRDTDIKTAEAVREGQKIKLAADAEIAESEKDKQIKMSNFKVEQERAKSNADVSYQLQDIENAKLIADGKAALAERDALVVEKQLIATVLKPAEAKKGETILNAQAAKEKKINEAQAEGQSITTLATANAEARKIAAVADAEAIIAIGKADASAIQSKGEAEAVAMEKKAEAYSKYNDAAMASMLIEILPELAGKIAQPLTAIDKVIVMEGGNGGTSGVGSIAGNVTGVMASVFESVEAVTGINLKDVIKGQTYDAKVTKNINFSGIPSGAATQALETVEIMDD